MHRSIQLQLPVLLASLLVLAGCATSNVPQLIRQAPIENPSLSLVQGQVPHYLGQTVRWGGQIIDTENQAQSTRVTLLAWPLTRDGEPRPGDNSPGRFIAMIPAFLDPAVYSSDRRFTVSGTITRNSVERIGDHPYDYPVVEAQAWYLWPENAATRGYPGWYDPWYGPYGYGTWYDPWYSPGWYPYYPYYTPIHREYRPHPAPQESQDAPRPPAHPAPRPRRMQPKPDTEQKPPEKIHQQQIPAESNREPAITAPLPRETDGNRRRFLQQTE